MNIDDVIYLSKSCSTTGVFVEYLILFNLVEPMITIHMNTTICFRNNIVIE